MEQRIRIARGSNENISNSGVQSVAGHVLYNTDKKYLYVGDGVNVIRNLEPVTTDRLLGDWGSLSADNTNLNLSANRNFNININDSSEMAIKVGNNVVATIDKDGIKSPSLIKTYTITNENKLGLLRIDIKAAKTFSAILLIQSAGPTTKYSYSYSYTGTKIVRLDLKWIDSGADIKYSYFDSDSTQACEDQWALLKKQTLQIEYYLLNTPSYEYDVAPFSSTMYPTAEKLVVPLVNNDSQNYSARALNGTVEFWGEPGDSISILSCEDWANKAQYIQIGGQFESNVLKDGGSSWKTCAFEMRPRSVSFKATSSVSSDYNLLPQESFTFINSTEGTIEGYNSSESWYYKGPLAPFRYYSWTNTNTPQISKLNLADTDSYTPFASAPEGTIGEYFIEFTPADGFEMVLPTTLQFANGFTANDFEAGVKYLLYIFNNRIYVSY